MAMLSKSRASAPSSSRRALTATGARVLIRPSARARTANCSSLIGLLGFSLLQGKTTKVSDDINEVTVQVVNLVVNHRSQMQPQG